MLDRLKYLDARLAEGSTWATISTLLVMVHINLDPGLWKQIATWGMAGAVAMGILLKDQTVHASLTQTVTDTLAGAAKTVSIASTVALPLVFAAVGLTACGNNNVAATTAEAAVALTAVEQAELEYVRLPQCPVATGEVCKDPATVTRLKQLDNVGYAAVKQALASGASADLVAANAAIAALQAAIPMSN